LVSWQHVTMEKDFGGLGVPSLRKLNLHLLGSWIRRYSLENDKLWKQVVDFKYDNCNPNVFTCVDRGASSFWTCVLWAVRAAKFGYRWKVGNGAKVRFWEDIWVGTSSLAIQFWDIYYIVNEQNKTVAELWDGVNLRCTFRRCVDRSLF
jgi:hypothetical protein